MMTGTAFTATVMAVLGALCTAGLHAGSAEQTLDQLRPIGEAPGQVAGRSLAAGVQGAQGSAQQKPAARATQQDPMLEQTRLRMEQHLKARRGLAGEFEVDPDSRRRNTRFGVGYEWRMRDRQGTASGAVGGVVGGATGGGPGGGPGSGFGGRR